MRGTLLGKLMNPYENTQRAELRINNRLVMGVSTTSKLASEGEVLSFLKEMVALLEAPRTLRKRSFSECVNEGLNPNPNPPGVLYSLGSPDDIKRKADASAGRIIEAWRA
jgi:hypothetical protein